MSLLFRIFVTIALFLPVLVYGQLPSDCGKGTVVIRLDYISLNGDTSIFQNSRYELSGNIVKRRAEGEPLVSKYEGEALLLESYVAEPEYDIDLKSRTVYVRKIEGYNGQDTVSLKDFSFDMFYRYNLIMADEKNEIDTINPETIERFGMLFKIGRYRTRYHENWYNFIYTDEKMPMVSPLSCFLSEFKGYILEIDLQADNQGVPSGVIKAIITDIE
ncbi:MAG: hypothetical protein LBE37_15900 [Sphingobacterium sp.]|jgi:hypothetical protein|nr:hypothetical protein [Sphingobacterium sp.]